MIIVSALLSSLSLLKRFFRDSLEIKRVMRERARAREDSELDNFPTLSGFENGNFPRKKYKK